MKIKFFLSDNEMAPTTISDNLFADSLLIEGTSGKGNKLIKGKKKLLKKKMLI